MKNIRSLWVAILVVLAHASFAEASECGQGAPKLVAPSDHATIGSSPVEMQWTAVQGAEKYRVWVIEDGLDLDVVGETTGTRVSVRLAPGEYGWFVEALFGECAPARSAVFVFEMERAENCQALAPAPLSPAEGEHVTSPVTFSWTPVPGAIAYEVSAALEDGEPVFVAESSETSLTAHLGEGRVRWVVEAEFSGCAETESVETSFVIPVQPGCDHDAPFPIAPASGAVDVPSRVEFLWTPVDGARGYRVLLVTDGNEDVRVLGTTTATRLSASVPTGAVAWSVVAEFDSCPPAASPAAPFVVAAPGNCTAPAAPEISVQPRALSGDSYVVVWSAESNVAAYEIEESAAEDFSGATTRIVHDIRADFSHDLSQSARYFYRVRSLSACGYLGASAYSRAAPVEVSPRTGVATGRVESAALYGRQDPVVQTMRLPGLGRPVSFTVHSDKPWLAVSPASGALPPDGIDLQLVAHPAGLPSGTSQATVAITYDEGGRRTVAAHGGGTSTNTPFSINLVTPVSPANAGSPVPGSLFLPAVATTDGFQSDVRIANTAAQVVQYLLIFKNRRTTIQIEAGQTAALNEIAGNFYGVAAGDDAGVLEIRPLTSKTAPATFASSRMYASGPYGTWGDYVPAIPFSKFIGKGRSVLSLQNITQSSLYRTSFALIEGGGERAAAIVSLFRADGGKLFDRLIELRPGEQLQVGDLLDGQTVDDGRIEIAVSSGSGKVTAYASVVDTKTGDPTLVFPIDVSRISSSRVMLPGIAHVDGTVSWRSSIHLSNAGPTDSDVTLMYIPQGRSDGPAITRTLRAGELLQMDDVLQKYFDVVDSAGAVLITTPKPASIVATASTFHRADGGAYGQLIPGIIPADGVGLADRALQILQVEESDRFRTNLGIVELTGKSATVEITAHVPDSKVSVVVELTLLPNEFRQIGSVLRALGLPATYNARITLKVIAGEGRVSGHASLVDNATHDPTYVPAQ